MCVSTINGETHNHTIQEKEPTKQQDIFAMDDSAVILGYETAKAGYPWAKTPPGFEKP